MDDNANAKREEGGGRTISNHAKNVFIPHGPIHSRAQSRRGGDKGDKGTNVPRVRLLSRWETEGRYARITEGATASMIALMEVPTHTVYSSMSGMSLPPIYVPTNDVQ